MATFKLGMTIARMAGEDLGDKLYYIAKMGSGETIVLCGDGEASLGVIHESAESGYPVSVQVDGEAKVIAGGTIVAGARVASDASGKAVTAASGDYTLGIAMEAAVVNQIFSVMLVSHGRGA